MHALLPISQFVAHIAESTRLTLVSNLLTKGHKGSEIRAKKTYRINRKRGGDTTSAYTLEC